MDTPTRPERKETLALSPLRAVNRAESQVLYGSHSPDGSSSAVVLYDFERRALVAREFAHEARDEIVPTTPPPGRCPLCNSELRGSTEREVSDSYFSTLAYFHRSALPAVSGPTAFQQAVGELHNIPTSLLVNGYYARFFNETKKLGSGSFGQVFLCEHVIDDVFLGEFAVKKIPVGDSREWLRGMMKEVKALERLASHANIVAYKHSWLEMDRANELCPFVPYLYILMSFCDAGSLEDMIWSPTRTAAVLPEATVWALFIDIAQGLQHLHRNFVLHRDLKPNNILLTTDNRSACGLRAVLSDFGTAEIVSESARASHSGFTGTVEYTAPEVIQTHQYSEASDMWSLGIVLFALSFNRVPQTHADPLECARLIASSNQVVAPTSPERGNDLKQIITALTARDPAKRPTCDDIVFHPFIRQKLESRRI